MADYTKRHLGEKASLDTDTKGRYKFPYGDFKAVYHAGLVAVKERAAQQDYLS